MSKLIKGYAKVDSLAVLSEAAERLGWTVEENGQRMRIHVHEEGATYHPYIDATMQGDQAELKYDHWMSFNGPKSSNVGADDHDDLTRAVIGKLKQTAAQVTVERMLNKQRANWRVETRQDGAKVYAIRRR